MIPRHLSITGFLSYQGTSEIDFTALDLACIVGANGSGKSSILDAITWVLFGVARRRDDSVINNQSQVAEVILVFEYEHNLYRVQRSKQRDKPAVLEFQILRQPGAGDTVGGPPSITPDSSNGQWKPLTGKTIRETEASIRETLRLDYETFTNASFFLQGKADQFTQQRPGDRKRVLGSILGLDTWEVYRQRTAEQLRQTQTAITRLDARLEEINAELDEEQERVKHLHELESRLERITQESENQEATLNHARQVSAAIDQQQSLERTLLHQLRTSQQQLDELRTRYDSRQAEHDELRGLITHAEQIEAAYTEWQVTRQELERWDQIASVFRDQEIQRSEPIAIIQAEQARLEQERNTLQSQQETMKAAVEEISLLQPQINRIESSLADAEARLARRESLQTDLQEIKVQVSALKNENDHMKQEMNRLNSRINTLRETEEPLCPTCGRMLNTSERLDLIDQLTVEGTALGDKFRQNKTQMDLTGLRENGINESLNELKNTDVELRDLNQELTRLNSQVVHYQDQLRNWEAIGALRLEEVVSQLEEDRFALDTRKQLDDINHELKKIGYDAEKHDSVRKAELEGRTSEAEIRELEKARSALKPLEREISDLEKQISTQASLVAEQEKAHQVTAESLKLMQVRQPDIHSMERDYFTIKETENQLRLEVGAARQNVLVLKDLKVRRKDLEKERESLARQANLLRNLERAFSKDGVPALLIEQALPQIEVKANQILERLTDGRMNVKFITQAEYKDKNRDDFKETLEIQISDSAGIRDYEMYSGGEAFRVNFAIRLALSEILAQRAGARLQTLVIDEGFGSQDTHGRQRLIEAINRIKDDFKVILVITHIEGLVDAFPNRLDVQKGDHGSTIRLI